MQSMTSTRRENLREQVRLLAVSLNVWISHTTLVVYDRVVGNG